MTVGELLAGGWNAMMRRPKELAIWSAIQLCVSVLMMLAIMPFMTAITQAQQQSLTGVSPGIPAELGIALLGYLLIFGWILMLFTAVVRATAAPGEDRFAWLRFAGDELRLIGLGLLLIIASMVFWAVFAMIITAVMAAVGFGRAGAGTAAVVGIVSGIVIICVAIWLSVRLSLIGAVFVLEKGFALRKGWRATKGHFWTLFLTFLIISIGYMILQGVVVAIMYPGYFSSGFNADPAQALARQQQMLTSLTSPSIGTAVMAIVGAVLGTAALVYYVGVISTAAISAVGYSRQDLAELESHFE